MRPRATCASSARTGPGRTTGAQIERALNGLSQLALGRDPLHLGAGAGRRPRDRRRGAAAGAADPRLARRRDRVLRADPAAGRGRPRRDRALAARLRLLRGAAEPLNVAGVAARLRALVATRSATSATRSRAATGARSSGPGWPSTTPDAVAALHLNTPGVLPIAGDLSEPPLSEAEAAVRPGGAALAPARGLSPARPGRGAGRARARPQRLAGRAGRVAGRQVPPLVGLRRRGRAPLLQGRPLRPAHPLLGDGDDRLLDAPLRGRGARPLAPRPPASGSRSRPRSPTSRPRSCARRAPGASGCSATCAGGPSSTAAATSPPSRSPSCSPTTWSPSSPSSERPASRSR